MKPVSIFVTIVLGLASLSFIVWVGRYNAEVPKLSPLKEKPEPTENDLPMPKTGPFGKVDAAETEYGFGTKRAGEDEYEHTFTLKNIGEGPLDFKVGKSTCQCTVGEMTKENGEVITEGPLAPGDSVKLLVKFRTRNQSDKFRQVVPVFTTDPDRRKVEFAIVGRVDEPFHLLPQSRPWDLGELSDTKPSTMEGYYVSDVYDEFTLVEQPREGGRMKLTIEPVDIATIQAVPEMANHPVKSGYRIKVEVPPDLPLGEFLESTLIKVGTAKEDELGHFSTLHLAVRGNRKGPIEIRGPVGAAFNPSTNRMVFPEFTASKGASGKITLFVKNFEDKLVMSAVEPDDTPIKVSFLDEGKTLGKTKMYQLKIDIPPGPPVDKRNFPDVVHLKLNHPEVPDLQLIIDYSSIKDSTTAK